MAWIILSTPSGGRIKASPIVGISRQSAPPGDRILRRKKIHPDGAAAFARRQMHLHVQAGRLLRVDTDPTRMISVGSTGFIALIAAVGGLLGAALSQPARRLANTNRARRLLHPATLAAMTAAAFAALAWRGANHPLALVVDVALAAACVPLAVIDLAEHRLPTRLVLPLYAVLLLPIAVHGFVHAEAAPALRAIAGMAALFLFYLAIAVVTGQLGAGDVRLAGVLGLVLAWHGWSALALGTMLGLFAAATAGIVAIVVFRRPRDHRIPLGAALIAGALAALLAQPAGLS